MQAASGKHDGEHRPGYQPMTIARLGELLASSAERERWLMISEFLEEHRHEPRERRLELLQAEPAPTGDERWDVFLAALAEHLAARGRAPRTALVRAAAPVPVLVPVQHPSRPRRGDRARTGRVPPPRGDARPQRAGGGVT